VFAELPLAALARRRFNVYVTQPEVKPGCVLRRSNWSVLEGRKLVDDTQARSRAPLLHHFRAEAARAAARIAACSMAARPRAMRSAWHFARMQTADARYLALQVNDCKRHMNTFAFVGDLEESPEVSCVYHSEQARHAARCLHCLGIPVRSLTLMRRALRSQAENQYLRDPLTAAMGDGRQIRDSKDSARSFD
jgi:hypothetical protein